MICCTNFTLFWCMAITIKYLLNQASDIEIGSIICNWERYTRLPFHWEPATNSLGHTNHTFQEPRYKYAMQGVLLKDNYVFIMITLIFKIHVTILCRIQMPISAKMSVPGHYGLLSVPSELVYISERMIHQKTHCPWILLLQDYHVR